MQKCDTYSFVHTRKRAGVTEYKLQLLQTILREGLPEISQGSCKANNGSLGNWWFLHIFVSPFRELMQQSFTPIGYFIVAVDFQFKQLTVGFKPFVAASTTSAVILKQLS